MQEKNNTFSSLDILDMTLSCTWNKHSGGLLQGPKLCDVLCLHLHHHKRGQETKTSSSAIYSSDRFTNICTKNIVKDTGLCFRAVRTEKSKE